MRPQTTAVRKARPQTTMRIAFIYNGAESLGVECLSATAKLDGHETALFFDPALFSGGLMHESAFLARIFNLRRKLIAALLRWNPRVAAFSAFTGNYQWALSIAREIKQIRPDIIIVFGGVHVTAVPHRVLPESAVDHIIVGEADLLFPRLLRAIQNNEPPGPIPGLGSKSDGVPSIQPCGPFVENLDDLPFPDKALFYDKAPVLEEHYMIMTGRGCPFSCTYCYKSLGVWNRARGPRVRRRSVADTIDELKNARSRGRAKLVAFRDDVFTLEKTWFREFTEAYPAQIGLPYFCYTHPAALDAEKADLMKTGGCRYVTMGVQAVHENLRRDILNRRYKNEQVVESARLLRERGIWVSVDHILGIPGDTEQHLRDAARFYNDLRPQRLLPFQLVYFPGAAIIDAALQSGALDQQQIDRIEQGFAGDRFRGGGGQTDIRIGGFAALFTLIPLLPRPLIQLLIRLRAERWLPSRPAVTNLFLALTAVIRRDPFFFHNVKFGLSRKNVP